MVPVLTAQEEIATIENENCQKGLINGHFCPNGVLTDESIYWFFCWVRSGGRSEKARIQALMVWNDIFDIPYKAFNENEFYKISQKKRYH